MVRKDGMTWPMRVSPRGRGVFFFSAIAVLVLCCASAAVAWQAKARTIQDGDSLLVTKADGAQERVRMYGIDAPEYKQPFGFQAKRQLMASIHRRKLEVESMDTDRYGRTVALVHTAEGSSVNEEMVRTGMAWVYDQYCLREDICAGLRQAEAEARTARRGLWAEENPTPPWLWRKEHKTEEWYAAPVRVAKKLVRSVGKVFR